MSHFPTGTPQPYVAHPSPPVGAPAVRRSRAAGPLLMIATITMGLMAGLFFAFDVSVMPGLAKGDDRTYVAAMQNFNALIDGSGLFGMVFVGALLATGIAVFLEHRQGRRSAALWIAAAAALYLVALVITFSVNIPLNNELAAAGDPAKITDFSIVDKFKDTWVATNIVRTLVCTAALGFLARALVLHGRGTTSPLRPGAV
ncbi:DUF1772 domain-containing protein [Streptomyces liangshanensis]|uniref:DUF1772 domain-containing protein n=1 Tax=Streptomyces liangshanensis TaxID=2717324 RepID=A0A6G9GS49_9ACTN|nr:DUF1772 domain-containing protein [Streptomyces liangshanensis]QIQ01083.1 DUF1772 domain-containing protein [Streptomyces liangshanensis]